MNVRIIAFTDRGEELALLLGSQLPGEVMRCGVPLSLKEWTERAFREAEGLVFIGAAGIAVRAIAPHIRNKTVDPAVVVLDETGQHAVSLLSGHLGGANDLTRKIAEICGAVPVITTATDCSDVFAVDAWARCQGCSVRNPYRIKELSAGLLSGGTIRIRSDWPISGTPPEGVLLTEDGDSDVRLSVRESGQDVLQVIPKIVVLGVGCKRGTEPETIEEAFQEFCAENRICQEALVMVCSIDRKADEAGLLEFCHAHDLPLQTYASEELRALDGDYSASAFVQDITGVDNVCERSAVKGSGGMLLIPKTAGNGVTMAAAVMSFAPNWRWRNG